jgi:hypothetical protein
MSFVKGTGKKVKRKTFTQGGRVYDASTLEAVTSQWRNYLKTDSTPTKKEFGEFLGKEVKGLTVAKMTGSAVTESEKKRLKALAKINKMRPVGTGRK